MLTDSFFVSTGKFSAAAAGITTQLHRTTAVVSPSDDPVGRGDGKIAAKADGEIAAKAGGLQRIAEDVSRAPTSFGGAAQPSPANPTSAGTRPHSFGV